VNEKQIFERSKTDNNFEVRKKIIDYLTIQLFILFYIIFIIFFYISSLLLIVQFDYLLYKIFVLHIKFTFNTMVNLLNYAYLF